MFDKTGTSTSFSTSIILGKVVDNKDPQKRGSVQVFIPQLHKSEKDVELPWALPVSPMFGGGTSTENSQNTNNWGFYMTPMIGDWVVLAPLHGDMNTLVYFGSIRSIFQRLPDTPDRNDTTNPTTYEIRFPNGNRMEVRTDQSDSTVLLETSKGYLVDINDTQDSITIRCGSSSAVLHSNGNIEVTGAMTVNITGTATVNVTSSGPVNVHGSTINMN